MEYLCVTLRHRFWSILSRNLHSTQVDNYVNRYFQYEVVNVVIKDYKVEGQVNLSQGPGPWLRSPRRDDA